MSILELFGFKNSANGASRPSDGLSEIGARIDALGEERSRTVAAFAAVLVRAARADLQVSEEETERMVRAVREFGGLDGETARLVVEMATELSASQGSSHDYLATRELRRLVGEGERKKLLHCLFAVCAADETITLDEEEEVRQVASELGFEHPEYVRARAEFREYRNILKK